jgi:hypothetical protein
LDRQGQRREFVLFSHESGARSVVRCRATRSESEEDPREMGA